ncbi:DNA internalization-related competence protein ComEC/Rec2 [Pseudomonas sp. NW5]|uniref:DNA internalization-related competence protein ComEC/Rec2 n=1 Tax=Pseudomonas sp. NW5 TaxID=2934934 RepID=UPI0020220949|nr:DNA internalization-related competence protein ComEC/Rec2 [Pseudomonas sp. NW5]MCL7461641.1 DNA internalization-related competence protein ComEC/Rec2 [Pseudomonas sp. NW5]
MHKELLALCVGLLSLRFLPALPDLYWPAAALLLSLLLLGWWPARPWAVLLVCLCLGSGWAVWQAQAVLDDRLASARDGQTLWLEGRISGLPEHSEGVTRFYLEQAHSRRGPLPARLRLSWHGAPALMAGEQWRLAVNLKRPRGSINPHGFDYEAWLTARKIGATGSVKQGERLQAAEGVLAWRDRLRQRLLAVPASERAGALAALVLGDGSGMSEQDWKVLRATGTTHLLVISGQHVAMLAGLLYGLVAGLFRLGLWPQRWPWLPSACLLALGGALAYGALAGFEVPVRRACLMTAIVLLWRWRYQHLGAGTALLLALAAVLLLDPLASLQAGFWLSFAAVALLVWCFAARLGRAHPLGLLLQTQWVMTLGLLPLLLALGLPLSVSALLANLLAVPWVSLGIVPLALAGSLLLGVPRLGEALLNLAGWQLQQLFLLLDGLAQRWPAWQGAALPPWAVLLALLGALLMLLPRGVPLRLPGLLLLAVALWPAAPTLPEQRAQIWVLDVGQGLAVLVRTRQHALLYDAGPAAPGFDSGEKILRPLLAGLGVRHLDLLLLSHADRDHAGGAGALLAGLSVGRLVSGEPLRGALPRLPEACRDGQQWQWDGVQFRTLQWQAAPNGNEASCVLQVEAGGERLLLTGDIGVAAERELLRRPGLQSDWLLVPHHGSRSSSSAAFIRAVAPRGALLTRRWLSPYGHPHPQVVARYQQLGVPLYDTAAQGALHWVLGRGEVPRGLRGQGGFWQEKPPAD